MARRLSIQIVDKFTDLPDLCLFQCMLLKEGLNRSQMLSSVRGAEGVLQNTKNDTLSGHRRWDASAMNVEYSQLGRVHKVNEHTLIFIQFQRISQAPCSTVPEWHVLLTEHHGYAHHKHSNLRQMYGV